MKNSKTLKFNWLASVFATACVVMPVEAQMFDADKAYVAGFNTQSAYDGALFSVDKSNGSRTVVSDFSDASQGPIGGDLTGMTMLNESTMLVLDNIGSPSGPALTSVDLKTGNRNVVSEFGNWGSQGVSAFYVTGGIVVNNLGQVLVTTPFAGTDFKGSLLNVDLATGYRTEITDFGNPDQGPVGLYPLSVLETSNGDTLVLTTSLGAGGGGLYSVDLITGQRTLLSDFGNADQGVTGVNPVDMAELPSGDIVVASDDVIFRVSSDGSRQMIANFSDDLRGPVSGGAKSIAVDSSGQIIAVISPGLLVSVNVATGMRALATGYTQLFQGYMSQHPVDLVLVQ